MERIDQIELGRYLKNERAKKAKEVLSEVKEDLQTEQGQLLLRVLKLLTQVNSQQSRGKPQADQHRKEPHQKERAAETAKS